MVGIHKNNIYTSGKAIERSDQFCVLERLLIVSVQVGDISITTLTTTI